MGEFAIDRLQFCLKINQGIRQIDRQEMAKQIGVSPSTITRIFQGKKPDVDTLAKIVAWAHCDFNDFVKKNK